MHQILITTYCGDSSVHTTTVGFNYEAQAVAAAQIINTNPTIQIDNGGRVHRHATMLFVPDLDTVAASSADRGTGIPGIDRDAVNRVIDRLGQAVKNVEQSKALEQVRSGLDRFVSSAEQLLKRQPTGARTAPGNVAEEAVASETSVPADESTAGMSQPKKIRYVRAADPTNEALSAAQRSAVAGDGDVVLIWVKAADMLAHEEVIVPRE